MEGGRGKPLPAFRGGEGFSGSYLDSVKGLPGKAFLDGYYLGLLKYIERKTWSCFGFLTVSEGSRAAREARETARSCFRELDDRNTENEIK